MIKYIGVCGKMGSGKDSVADIIVKNGLADGKVSFAARLKTICKDIFDNPGSIPSGRSC